nr:DUF4365 domain-containing protein [Blastococcus sp. TF02-9]
MSNLQRINWGPVENTRHDLGTDIFCQVRDERRFDLGLFVGIQVKSGDSWFDDKIRDEAGNVTGWWYYESEPRHFEYWTSHTLPHFVVLNDEATRISYWAHVTPDRLKNTGQGFKIAIPSEQKIDLANLPALIQVAATQRKGFELAGSSWRAGVSELGPGKRLRHALLAPRLVAPHRNARPQGTLEPEEAIAMVALGRFSDFQQLATADEMTPDTTAARHHQELRWRFLACLWAIAEEADDALEMTRSLLSDCSIGSADHAAATALLICQFAADEQWDEAIAIAMAALDGDQLAPADSAWISSHLAGLLVEVGGTDDARDAALGVLRNLAGLEPDVTTLALQAAASWIVFSTADISAHVTDRSDLLSSIDNPVAWWREQTASYGLNDAVLKEFRARLKDSTERWTVEDVAYARLWSAAMTAQLAADYGVSRLHLRQMGRYPVSQGLQLDDSSMVSEGMMALLT